MKQAMGKKHRVKIAKNIVFIGWIFAIIGAISILLLRLGLIETDGQIPIWIIPFFVLGSVLMLAGVLLGSRGIGVPLDKERFFTLSLGYPCWVAAVIYIGVLFLSRFV